ncbi:MAG: hypothetical protein ACYTFA_08880 [Planctomycetota bacterium]
MKNCINWMCQPHFLLIVSVIALIVFLVGYRVFTRPVVAVLVAVFAVLIFLASCSDANFLRTVSKGDNVPVVMMVFAVGFFLRLSFRQAAAHDRRAEEGKPLREAGADDKVPAWPDLGYTELIAMALCTACLTVWAVVIRAPLQQPADPYTTPSLIKAPWYFVGAQEMHVYFDPWLAGVVFPALIVVGLLAIPYIDKNPRGNGYYTFKERPFAITTFMFGFCILWAALIVVGIFLRGPNWDYFGPYEYWDPQRPAAFVDRTFGDMVSIEGLGRAFPDNYLIRELPGILLLAAYFILGPFLLRVLFFRRMYYELGWIRYTVTSVLLLVMLLIPIKMVLHWTLNLHYIVGITEWFFNV